MLRAVPGSTFLALPRSLWPVRDEAEELAAWRDLGKHVSWARGRKGMTQQELADAVGVTVKTINTLERGRATGMRAPTKAMLEGALDWMEGDVDRVLAGARPRVRQDGVWPTRYGEAEVFVGSQAGAADDELAVRLQTLHPSERALVWALLDRLEEAYHRGHAEAAEAGLAWTVEPAPSAPDLAAVGDPWELWPEDLAARRGESEGRRLREALDQTAEAPDREGPEQGA